ncbi:hypothetical protein CLV48_1147 [Cecembia rubra]|uniref:Uncharacterized protein n=1 Tax=Cecembia rubra TaxID=1485585 RepID=A0A2P8DVH2_9BACT|nr:hypothetical protein CLV48_1147 [Cecembia rubra]
MTKIIPKEAGYSCKSLIILNIIYFLKPRKSNVFQFLKAEIDN